MTRIYFKPAARQHGRIHRQIKPAIPLAKASPPNKELEHTPHTPASSASHSNSIDVGWKAKIDPSTMDQIADNLEKMVLSWSQPNKQAKQEVEEEEDEDEEKEKDEERAEEASPKRPIYPIIKGNVGRDPLIPSNSNSNNSSRSSSSTSSSSRRRSFFISGTHRSLSIHHHHHHPPVGLGFEEILGEEAMADADSLAEQALLESRPTYWYLPPPPKLALPSSTLTLIEDDGKSGSAAEQLHKQEEEEEDEEEEHRHSNDTPTTTCCSTGAAAIGSASVNATISSSTSTSTRLEEDGKEGILQLVTLADVRAFGGTCRETLDSHNGFCETSENSTFDGIPEKASYHMKPVGSRDWREAIEIAGGENIEEMLGKRIASLGSHDYASLLPTPHQIKEESAENYKKKVEELEIALLECAMEYEVKIVEMKMTMLQMKNKEESVTNSKSNRKVKEDLEKPGEDFEISSTVESHQGHDASKSVEYLRKKLGKLQKEKHALSRELSELSKRERQFDLQRRSLDDALHRVNSLQRDLGKREREIVECQLREKEVKAQLYEAQMALQRAQCTQLDPKMLLSMLPTLLQNNNKKAQHLMEPVFYHPKQHEKAFVGKINDNNMASPITKDVQELQRAMSKIASNKHH